MSQRDTLRAMDASILGALNDAGLTDEAAYVAPGAGSVEVPCHVLVDREQELLGDAGQVVGMAIAVTIYRTDIEEPVRGAVLTLAGTGEVFTLRSKLEQDESVTVWVVSNV